MGRAKIEFLFDVNQKRIVALRNEIYYNMGDGKVIGHLSIAYNIIPKKLQPFKVENRTKWIPIDENLISQLKKTFPYEYIEYGIKFNLDGHTLWLIFDDQDNFQLSGRFPIYFFKGLIKLMNHE